MFESFYRLEKTPFSRDIPTNQLYQSHIIDEAGCSGRIVLILPAPKGHNSWTISPSIYGQYIPSIAGQDGAAVTQLVQKLHKFRLK